MWVLDPGHGGVLDGVYQTKGKRSPVWEDGTQYFEGEGNRNLAKKVADILDDLGISYVYTVEPDDPTDIPLAARTNFINKLNYKLKMVVSIHSDAFSAPQAHGWSVFTSPGETTSDKVATVFYKEFVKMFPEETVRDSWRDGDADKEANFYILKKTKCPAILLENFFMTNPRECKEILMTEEGQDKIASYIANSILYIEENGLR